MEGYDKLALLFSKYPELVALRRFRQATMKCLLYKQAELSYLEQKVNSFAKFNKEENEKLATSYREFTEAKGDDVKEQRQVMADLEAKLSSYHAMLRMTTDVLKLEASTPSNIETLKDWLGRPDGGKGFLTKPENIIECTPWLGMYDDDLVGVEATLPDKFADYISEKLLPSWHDRIGHRFAGHDDPVLGKIWPYRREAITFIGNVICMLLSFSIPTASIFGLNYIQTMRNRLIMVSAFIFLFAFAMMFVVGSRRGEVFAATAAFAAIQVVFVGSVNLGEGSN